MFNFICTNDIENDSTVLRISDLLIKSDKFIYLTSTQSLKNIRAYNEELVRMVIPYKNNKSNANLFSFAEFSQYISKSIYKNESYMSTADSRYILAKVIEYKFSDNKITYNTFYKMRYDLFELFRLLMFYNKKITSEQIAEISHNFSIIEEHIFDLYSIYKEVTDEVINMIRTGKESRDLNHILGREFLKKSGIKPIDTFASKQKALIAKKIKSVNAVFFDGFLFFDDLQAFVVRTAILEKKPVYFIYKTFNDKLSNFIFDSNIKLLAKELCINNIELPVLTESKSDDRTALDYVRGVFPTIPLTPPPEICEKYNDGSIRIIEPFVNREEELRFVVKDISNRLKEGYTGDINALKSLLNNDIAIITGIEKEKYQERISNLFREIGLFIYKGKESLINAGFEGVDDNDFEKVYFNRDDFLNTNIENADYTEKHIIFERCFSRIKINKNQRPIATYPIGQFVIELYNIIKEGMSVEGYKAILYSNWRYTLDKTDFHWSDFISDFKYIEMFVEGKTSIYDWAKELENIKQTKADIAVNPLYKYHPIAQIPEQSIEFFRSLIKELITMTEQIKSVLGGIDKHLEALKTVVMKADNLLHFENDDLEFEQVIVKRIVNAIEDIGSSSLMNTLDSRYFAENIRLMLIDWENQNETEDDNDLRLNVVNLENMKKYRHTYFIMLEADKYPRKYYEKFPYNKDILTILSDSKYGINIRTGEVLGLDYHLQLERYLFKNVLDFTTESITITNSEKEYEKHTRPSVFLSDISSAFGRDVEYIKTLADTPDVSGKFTKLINEIKATDKQSYTLTELATFKLCPRLYYHNDKDDTSGAYLNKLQLKFYAEAIMYCDLFRRFMDYNLENRAVYRKDDTEYKKVLKPLLDKCFDDNIKNFSFLQKYEISDIKRNVANKILGFIENGMQYVKSNQYTIISHVEKTYDGNGYELVIGHDNRYVDYINRTYRMSQNNTYLEFLVLKTSDGKSHLIHYEEMIKALDANDPNEDRINLVSRIIAKINIQFDSKRFANDGTVRTDKLVSEIKRYDLVQAQVMKSDYCGYCRLRNICMGV